MNKWKKVWNKKNCAEDISGLSFEELFLKMKLLAGYDSHGTCKISFAGFCKEYYEMIECLSVREGNIKKLSSLYEIGCGSGFVSAVLSAEVRAFSEDPAHPERRRKKMILTACDISPAALEQTEKCVSGDTGIRPDHFRLIRSDLFSAFSPDDRFDLIIFNPPYLPTSEDEKVPGGLNYAFDGGLSGRDTIDRFLENAAAHLLPGGSVLLLISSITGPDEVSEKMSRCGLSSEIAGTVRCSFEELMVLRGHLL